MNKIQVDILGLSASQAGTNAFALLLKEAEGPRRLTIVIGVPEAQAIANELEGIHAQRPMTHDLLRNVIEALGGQVQEVVITSLREGTYYATIVFAYSGLEVDARPSDAIALAVRCGVPVLVNEDILDDGGSSGDGDDATDDGAADDDEEDDLAALGATTEKPSETSAASALSYRERLEKELTEAIAAEDYERAARLRDELAKLHD